MDAQEQDKEAAVAMVLREQEAREELEQEQGRVRELQTKVGKECRKV